MEFKVVYDNDELQAKLNQALFAVVEETIAVVRSWDVREIINKAALKAIETSLDAMIIKTLSEKDLQTRVNQSIDSIIKTKVKKAMKGG